MSEETNTEQGQPRIVPDKPERVIYLCPVCRIQWLTTAGAWACCEKIHRGGQSAYGDTIGRAGVQCHGRQLHRLRSIIRRAERDAEREGAA